jgi:hypothetical protein
MQLILRMTVTLCMSIRHHGGSPPVFRSLALGFAICTHARDRYQDAVLLAGPPIGSPQEALDTASTVHLTALEHEPKL